MRYSALHFYVVTMAVAFLSLAGCSKGGGPGPNPDPITYRKTITPKDADTKATLSDAVTYNADTDAKLGDGRFSLKREAGTKLSLRTELSGYRAETTSISFHETGTVTITLTKDTPDSVSITYDVKDAEADSLVKAEADLTVDGSPVSGTAGKAKGTLTLPYGDSAVTICATADYFKDSGNCTSVTPDADKPAHLTLSRKQVTVAVSVTDQSGGSIDDPSIQVDDYTYGSGEKSHDFGARSGKRTVFATAAGYDSTRSSVSAGSGQTLTVKLDRLPACSDGIDNDGDGKIDADDSGCVDSQASTSRIPGSDGFVYDPKDDNEVLLRFELSGRLTSVNRRFSSKKGDREEPFAGNNFSDNIALAVGEIDFSIENQIEKSQTGEAFAIRIQCGPESEPRSEHSHTITTDIVPDDQSVDGWRTSTVHGFTRAILQNGTDCGYTALHASKVRGDPPGDGKDDIFLSTNDRGGLIVITWFYEEEEVK